MIAGLRAWAALLSLGSDETGAKPADVYAPLAAQPSGLTDSSRPSSGGGVNTEQREQATCDHGCGPGDGYRLVGGLGFGIVPACPVHGWVCAQVDALLARLSAVEQERDEARDYVASLHGAKSYEQLTDAEARVEALEAALRTIAEDKRVSVPMSELEQTVVDGQPASVVYVRREKPDAVAVARAVLAPSQQEEK